MSNLDGEDGPGEVFKRWFRCTRGPLIEALQKLQVERATKWEQFKALGAELGGDIRVYSSGRVAGVDFKDRPGPGWRGSKRVPGLWVPKLSTKEGSLIGSRIQALGNMRSWNEALTVIDQHPDFPVLMDGRNGYSAQLGFYRLGEASPVVFVVIPWRKVSEEVLARYRAEKAAGTRFSTALDHLLWTPPAELVEIKHWEYLKEIEELEAESESAVETA